MQIYFLLQCIDMLRKIEINNRRKRSIIIGEFSEKPMLNSSTKLYRIILKRQVNGGKRRQLKSSVFYFTAKYYSVVVPLEASR